MKLLRCFKWISLQAHVNPDAATRYQLQRISNQIRAWCSSLSGCWMLVIRKFPARVRQRSSSVSARLHPECLKICREDSCPSPLIAICGWTGPCSLTGKWCSRRRTAQRYASQGISSSLAASGDDFKFTEQCSRADCFAGSDAPLGLAVIRRGRCR